MTTLVQTTTDVSPVSDGDAALARDSGQAIARFLDGNDTLKVTFESPGGERMEATLPAFAVRLLARILTDITRGKPVTLLPRQAELTTHQAARMLHVSRPVLIKLLNEGQIPYRKVGTHRRIRYEDVQAYLERERAARRETLRELAAYDQEIGLYDLEEK